MNNIIYIVPVFLCIGMILLVLALLTDEADEVDEKLSYIFFWLSVAFLSITYILLVFCMCIY
mgnify:CR=1 FL=1